MLLSVGGPRLLLLLLMLVVGGLLVVIVRRLLLLVPSGMLSSRVRRVGVRMGGRGRVVRRLGRRRTGPERHPRALSGRAHLPLPARAQARQDGVLDLTLLRECAKAWWVPHECALSDARSLPNKGASLKRESGEEAGAHPHLW